MSSAELWGDSYTTRSDIILQPKEYFSRSPSPSSFTASLPSELSSAQNRQCTANSATDVMFSSSYHSHSRLSGNVKVVTESLSPHSFSDLFSPQSQTDIPVHHSVASPTDTDSRQRNFDDISQSKSEANEAVDHLEASEQNNVIVSCAQNSACNLHSPITVANIVYCRTVEPQLMPASPERICPLMTSGYRTFQSPAGSTLVASIPAVNTVYVAEDASNKRQIHLMKNREAARVCRRKKKEYLTCLEMRVSVLENQNRALIEELRSLKELYQQRDSLP